MMGVGGLPPIQRANAGSVVATRTLAGRLEVGFAYEDLDGLRADLEEEVRTGERRAAMWRVRDQLTFDAHVDRLVGRFASLVGRRPAATGREPPAPAGTIEEALVEGRRLEQSGSPPGS
jgi:hypothetical protein